MHVHAGQAQLSVMVIGELVEVCDVVKIETLKLTAMKTRFLVVLNVIRYVIHIPVMS